MGDILFGGSSTSTQQLPTLTSGQSGLLSNLSNFLSGSLGQQGPIYGGKFTPGITPLMSEWFSDIKAMPEDQLWKGASDVLLGAMAPYSDASAKDYWANAIKTPALNTFNKDILPGIAEQFAGNGAMDSGAFANAVADAGSTLSGNLGASLAQVLFQDKNAYSTRALSAAGQGSSMAQTLANLLQQPAQMEYADEATNLQMKYQDWLRSLPENQLAKLAPLFGQALGTRGFENVVTQRQTPGILGSLLSAGASLGGAAMRYL
jgi:hypothetical protein